MMSTWKSFVTSTSILLLLADIAVADCSAVPGAATFPDGTWLFSTNGSWRPIAELKSVMGDGRSRRVNFLYVASEPGLGTFRRGILVVKTGVNSSASKNG